MYTPPHTQMAPGDPLASPEIEKIPPSQVGAADGERLGLAASFLPCLVGARLISTD